MLSSNTNMYGATMRLKSETLQDLVEIIVEDAPSHSTDS